MKIPRFFTKKRIIWGIIIVVVLLIGFLIFGRGADISGIQTALVEKQNLEETVLTTGQVVSGTDLSLGFQGSGVVRQILVKEGDGVNSGQVLARLDQAGAIASLTSAQGTLAQAQANYQKLVNGATPEELKTYQDSVLSAQQDLNNIYNGAFNTLNDAYIKIYNAYTTVFLLRDTYFTASDQTGLTVTEGRDNIFAKMTNARTVLDAATTNPNIDLAVSSFIADLNSTLNSLTIIRQQCDQGAYYFKVSVADKSLVDTQKSNISTAITSVNSLQHSIASNKIALQKAEDTLSQKQARPRQEDVDLANAQILSAQGSVASAQALVGNLTLIAPASGTITQVDIKVGEQATSLKEVMILQNIQDLHTEANVSEANIASLVVGQTVDYTFDALGPNRHFTGTILTVNPSSIIISGVVNYKVTGSLENIPDIKPGMTANMTIMVAQKDGVLAVPSSAIIEKDSNQYVRVVNNPKTKTYHEVQIQTGLQADGGMVEITSGLTEGQEIITYIKP